jgi:hypothetical protein
MTQPGVRVRRTAPSFLIVGTPRSGTTLVQRLACEVPGVRVPYETHFFAQFYPRRFRWGFPLDGDDLRQALAAYADMKNTREFELDVEAVVDALGGRCDGPLAMFEALVRVLAGEAAVYGEKTPTHLAWWRPLTRAIPTLRVVAVVRDPRAAVASQLRLPWGPKGPQRDVLAAERWRGDQRQVGKMREELGPERCLVVRYEDVVGDPDGARRSLARFVGGDPEGRVSAGGGFVLPREWWKGSALDDVDPGRTGAWSDVLAEHQLARIETVCRREMRRFGYPTAPRGHARLGLGGWAAVFRARLAALRDLRRIEGTSLGATP